MPYLSICNSILKTKLNDRLIDKLALLELKKKEKNELHNRIY